MNRKQRRAAQKNLRQQGIDSAVTEFLTKIAEEEQKTGKPVLIQEGKCPVLNLFNNPNQELEIKL